MCIRRLIDQCSGYYSQYCRREDRGASAAAAREAAGDREVSTWLNRRPSAGRGGRRRASTDVRTCEAVQGRAERVLRACVGLAQVV